MYEMSHKISFKQALKTFKPENLELWRNELNEKIQYHQTELDNAMIQYATLMELSRSFYPKSSIEPHSNSNTNRRPNGLPFRVYKTVCAHKRGVKRNKIADLLRKQYPEYAQISKNSFKAKVSIALSSLHSADEISKTGGTRNATWFPA